MPNIRAAVMQNTSKTLLSVLVYSAKPRLVRVSLSFWIIETSSPFRLDRKPSCGMGLPVSIREMKMAGTV